MVDNPSVPEFRSQLGTRLLSVLEEFQTRREAAGIADVTAEQLNAYVHGKTKPPFEVLARLAFAKGVSLDWLATGMGKRKLIERSHDFAGADGEEVLVPRYDVALAAGTGRLLDEANIIDFLPVPRRALLEAHVEPASVVAFMADGRSMEPTIRSGEDVLCDRSKTTVRSDLVYAFRMNGELRLKRLTKGIKVDLIIRSDNSEFPDEMLDYRDVEDFEIIGRVFSVYNRWVE